MATIGVDCTFSAGGTIHVRRVEIDGTWAPVGQGRQWLDQDGQHVLIKLPGEEIREILLRPDTMTWEIKPGRNQARAV